ncbi:hypothetical protein [Bradyrhizobium sp. LB13.1]
MGQLVHSRISNFLLFLFSQGFNCMARRRVPLLKAEATGRTLHDPKRFKSRREPKSNGPLGDPPKWMTDKHQIAAWRMFSDELPWCNKQHRTLVAIASQIRGQLIAGTDVSVSGLNLLRLCLAQLGATPSDSSKVSLPDDEASSEDASAKYF